MVLQICVKRDQPAKMTWVVAFSVWYLAGNFTVFWPSTKPHYRQQGQVCKAGTGITEGVSSEERTSDFPGRWITWPAAWRWRQRLRSFELPGWRFIAEKPVPVRCEGKNPGRCRSEVGTSALWRGRQLWRWISFFRLSIHGVKLTCFLVKLAWAEICALCDG